MLLGLLPGDGVGKYVLQACVPIRTRLHSDLLSLVELVHEGNLLDLAMRPSLIILRATKSACGSTGVNLWARKRKGV